MFPGKRRIDTFKKKRLQAKNRKRDIAYSFTVGGNLKNLMGIKYATLTNIKFGQEWRLSDFAKRLIFKEIGVYDRLKVHSLSCIV